MSDEKQKLNIVNEKDGIIGIENRNEIHTKGLLHREIHVWFYTPQREIVFQHRAKDKDTYPDLLDATVGGHVEIGDDYLTTAIKETKEETGLDLSPKDLIPLIKIKRKSHDLVTNKINYAYKQEYVYKFEGNVSNLKIEKGKAIGFEAVSIDKILNPDESIKKHFIPGIFSPDMRKLFENISSLM